MSSPCARCGAPLETAGGPCRACAARGPEHHHETLVLTDDVPPPLAAPSVAPSSPTLPAATAPSASREVASGGSGPDPFAPIVRAPSSRIEDDPLLAAVPACNGHKVLGGVRLLRRIGQGGMGAVYAGEHVTLGQKVAVKILPGHLRGDPSYAERFLREAQVSFSIDHHNVVRTINAGNEHGILFLQMEFVDGYSAAELLRHKGRISEKQALGVVLDATRGLAEAHRRGIVHRDVKPDNVLIRREDGRAKIADLGLARISKSAETSPAITGVGTTLGTPAYMAPEQIEDASHVGAAADVYSLGATLYELLCGRPPFQTSSIPSLFHEILTTRPPDPKRFRPEISPAVRALVLRALEKKPAARFETADAFAAALEQALALATAVTPPPPPLGAAAETREAVPAPRPEPPPVPAPPAPPSAAVVDAVAPRWRGKGLVLSLVLAAVVVAAVVGGWFLGRGVTPGTRTYVIAVLPDRRLTTTRLKAMQPVLAYLREQTHRTFELYVGATYEENLDAFLRGKADVAQFGGVTYVLARKREPGTVPIFQRDGDREFQTTFVARHDSDLATLSDLKGKRIAFVDRLSTAGFVVPAIALLDAGFEPRAIDRAEFTHAHDASLEAVLSGTVDAAAVDASMAARLELERKVKPGTLKILKVTDPFPDDVWVASPGLEEKVRVRVQEAFLKLDPAHGGQELAVLQALEARRYVTANDADYEDLRRKVERLQSAGLLPGN